MKSRWIAQLFIVCFIIGLFVLAMNYNSYVLIIYDGGYSADFDISGH